MRKAYELPAVRIASVPAHALDAEAIVLLLPDAEAGRSTLLGQLPSHARQDVDGALSRGAFTTETARLHTVAVGAEGWGAPIVVVAGIGDGAPERIRRAAAAATLALRTRRLTRIGVVLPTGPDLESRDTRAAVEGVVLGNFDHGHLKTRDPQCFVSDVQVVSSAAQAVVAEACIIGDSVNAARLLTNEPGNDLPPRRFAERAAELASVPGVKVRVLEPPEMQALGMGMLLGVGQASAEPPRLMCFEYSPERPADRSVLALVGKGVTFDTGGISLKPADGMERMKDDMAGGAAVVSALRAIARLQLPRRVMAIVPSVENMPGGRALKPGDVLRSASGLTVEVNNTDAEGRLILGDALWYARERGATHLVDVATLTGACIVALGKITTGLFGTPPHWVEAVQRAAAVAGEAVWPMPVADEYREALKSDVADLLNSPGRPAGAITAAMFLREFTGGLPWAHLDIAGTAWQDDAKPWAAKGATGVMTRTLIELARAGTGA